MNYNCLHFSCPGEFDDSKIKGNPFTDRELRRGGSERQVKNRRFGKQVKLAARDVSLTIKRFR